MKTDKIISVIYYNKIYILYLENLYPPVISFAIVLKSGNSLFVMLVATLMLGVLIKYFIMLISSFDGDNNYRLSRLMIVSHKAKKKQALRDKWVSYLQIALL